MPIRFRCAYCSQLMGIAKRKAGTIVRCPRCSGELIVPALPDPEPPAGDGAARQLNDLIEADDFAHELDVEPAPRPPNPLMPPPAYTHPPLTEPDSRPPSKPVMAPPPRNVRRSGLFLSPGMLILAGALGAIAVILGFVFGIIIGRLM